MSEQITNPVNLFYDAFTVKHDTAAAGMAFADNAVVHWHSQTMDVPNYEQVGKTFLIGFPDLSFQMEDQFVAGDKVVTRGTWSGTNTGSLMGMPVTGKPFRVAGTVIDRVVDGKIVERWETGDVFGLMQQIGVILTPQA